MRRRQFLAVAGSLLATARGAPLAAAAGEAPGPCNVVVLVSDEHNPRYTQPYGHPRVQTPHLLRLAARGTVYENMYCASPLCMPSRSAFMSGLRCFESQVYSNCSVIQHDYPAYGAVLRAQGVHTVHMGKTDVYRPTAELGFSEFAHPKDRGGPGDTVIGRNPVPVRKDGAQRANEWGPKDGNPWADDDAVVDTAVHWLRTRPQALDRPFTLCVNVVAPHFPVYATRALWEKYADAEDLPAYGMSEASAQHAYAREHRRHFQTEGFTEAQIRGLRRGYLACVDYVDSLVGRLLDVLDETGLSKNTVFAYTSDHGEMLGHFGMWWKCSLYEDAARVPLIVAGPGFAPGARASTPVNTLDVQAALFHATRRERPAHWHGEPLQRLALNDTDRILFGEYHGHAAPGSAFFVRQAEWKYLWYAGAPAQLFNLAEDPFERNNLAEAAPDRRARLHDALRAICDPENENRRADEMIARQLARISEMHKA
jgi:choline-sulfatase